MATTDLEATTVESLADQLRGTVSPPGDEGYDEARTVWNAMIDREPAVVARCAGNADVIAAVNFARDLGLPLSVHGGGHNVAGNAVCDGGVMIDLSPMSEVRVDPERQVARVGGGATLADLDHETQAFGLATTGGIVSTTGVAGLTLGGGLGWLARKHGLAHDNLRAVDIVTADGELVRASEEEYPELFWGIRGSGGNLGVVTSFEFDLHELETEVLAGIVLHRMEDATDVLRAFADFMADAPDDVNGYAGFGEGTPELGVPEALQGESLVVLFLFHAGPIEAGSEELAPVRDIGEPIVDAVQPIPYTEWQQSFDHRWEEGYRHYWKSHFLETLSDDAIETIVDHADGLPTPSSSVFIEWMGGAIARADADATAFPHRDAVASLTIAPMWSDPVDDEANIDWARRFFDATAPYATGNVYVNYLSDDEEDRVRAAYGDHYDRLVQLKQEWDPDNLFSSNQNIAPGA